MSVEEHKVSERKPRKRGFLRTGSVRAFAFWTITLCVVISVIASILAIWEFAGTDVLWRTVATCVVVGIGTGIFAFINNTFGVVD
jgi:hypothetical protein